jgi:hypothetical protein
MNPQAPVTKEEALRYKKEDLEREVTKLRQGIKLFQDEIVKSEAQINRIFQMIAIIDTNP